MPPPDEDAGAPHPLSIVGGPRFAQGLRTARLVLDEDQRAAADALAQPVRHGFYLWGPVGRGKTLLAERYYQALPTRRKRRFHVHGFFRALQGEILGGGGAPGALTRIFGTARAVLFDEFHVHDVADARSLALVLRWLRERNVLVIATSNDVPEDLLTGSAAHDASRPVMELLRSEFEVIGFGSGRDYRRDPPARAVPARLFAPGARGFSGGSWTLSTTQRPAGTTLLLQADGLPLRAVSATSDEAVLAFEDLCETPVSAGQYLWLAASFPRIVVTRMPDPALLGRDAAARLVSLVDVLHDRGTELHVVAAGRPEWLLDAVEQPRGAARAVSRLVTLRVIDGE